MTPAGHASISYIAGRFSSGLSIPAAIMGGLLMDIDFLLLPFSFFNSIHRIWTHNFLFLAVSLGIAAVFIQKRRGPILMGLLVGGMLHLLLDSILDTNPSNGIGVFLLYPFSNEPFSLLNMPLPSFETHSLTSWLDPFSQLNIILKIILWETPFYACALFLFSSRIFRKKYNA